jgi:NAD(P)H-nitrite reductase large subunit
MTTRGIVILGNGITGITAARHIRKRSNDHITIVSGETEHPFSRPALMYLFMGDLTYNDTKLYPDHFWEKNRISLKCGWVDRIEIEKQELLFKNGDLLRYDVLVLATGSQPNRFGWPGQDLEGVQSLYTIQDVESMERHAARTKRAVIAGGGLIGVEVAEMLLSRGIAVTFLIREKLFWNIMLPDDEAAMVNREIQRHGVDLRMESELKEILPDATGHARAILLKSGEEIPCEMVFLTVGVAPNIDVVKASGIECDRGVLVNPFFQTSAPGVFAGGDCAQHREIPLGRRPVEQVWYTGKMHGEHIAANICGEERPYLPGVWFNSAKFFDIEYQTYGIVMPQLREGEESFYWEHPEGDKSIRINFRADTGELLGVNVFGMRHRHAVWETWLTSHASVEVALSDLGAANFDPEFFRQYEHSIIAAFNVRYPGRAVTLRTHKGLFSAAMTKLLNPSPRQNHLIS